MSERTSQRLIASSIILGTSAVFLVLLKHIPWDQLSLVQWLVFGLGVLSWGLIFSACAIIVLHPEPRQSHWGRIALSMDPYLNTERASPKRTRFTLSVVGFATFSVLICILSLTDTIYVLYERFLFAK